MFFFALCPVIEDPCCNTWFTISFAAPGNKKNHILSIQAEPRPTRTVVVQDRQEMEPFAYFDSSYTTLSSYVHLDRIESLLYSTGSLCYREVLLAFFWFHQWSFLNWAWYLCDNMTHSQPFWTFLPSNVTFHVKDICNAKSECSPMIPGQQTLLCRHLNDSWCKNHQVYS